MIWEKFATMTEDYENPETHCPECDPEQKEEGTMKKYIGSSRPSFNLKGDGWFKGGWN
jgi:predicted nucleic acid-binding Zn ribbon protein